MAHRIKLTDRVRAKFLALLADGNTVTFCANAVNMAKQSLYANRDKDETFRQQWDEALEAGIQRLEQEAIRRAVVGVPKPVYSQGRYVADVQEFSDPLLMFILKAKRPATYRDNSRVELTGKDGGPVEHRSTNDPDEALDAAERAYLAALRAKSAAVGGPASHDRHADAGAAAVPPLLLPS